MIGINRATRTIMMIVILSVVCYFPYMLARLMGNVGTWPPLVIVILQSAGSMVSYINIGVNVFIYN